MTTDAYCVFLVATKLDTRCAIQTATGQFYQDHRRVNV